MNPFLKAKHWQLFTLFFGIPMILQVVWMLSFFSYADLGFNEEGMAELRASFPVLLSFGLFLLAILLGWYASVAIGLRQFTPKKLRLNLRPFYVACVIPAVHLTVFALILFRVLERPEEWNIYTSNAGITLFFIAHIMAMGCVFYIPYYAAKAYKIALLRRKVKREEVVSEFLLMWFLFIGIWFLQPRINLLVQGETDPKEVQG